MKVIFYSNLAVDVQFWLGSIFFCRILTEHFVYNYTVILEESVSGRKEKFLLHPFVCSEKALKRVTAGETEDGGEAFGRQVST